MPARALRVWAWLEWNEAGVRLKQAALWTLC